MNLTGCKEPPAGNLFSMINGSCVYWTGASSYLIYSI
jgi:hypothetical protein